MSAIVCGKRSLFEELHSPPPVSKRLRCAGGSSPIRLSPSRVVCSAVDSPLLHLRELFPDMDAQPSSSDLPPTYANLLYEAGTGLKLAYRQLLLERTLEACGNDLDSAIKSLNELCLRECNAASAGMKPDVKAGVFCQESVEVANDDATAHGPSPTDLPADGLEWVELLVREMMSACDMNDAKLRASRILEVLEKSIMSRAGEVVAENLRKENMLLKEHFEALLRDNQILKRAVTIQHERQKEYDERGQELQHLKQLVSQYQEQVRTLEVNNYALTMHLQQAQQSSSIPGHFHPDVF